MAECSDSAYEAKDLFEDAAEDFGSELLCSSSIPIKANKMASKASVYEKVRDREFASYAIKGTKAAVSNYRAKKRL